jgi:N-acetylglutamate synthase-like GNAT family acetyltransferase
MRFNIRALREADRERVAHFLETHWGSSRIVTRGRIHHADELPGFLAEVEGELVGLLTYQIERNACEIVSLNSTMQGRGIGSALLSAVKESAVALGCKRLWLVTTNDNTPAIHYYQMRGFDLVAVHRNAIERSRELKPEIPACGLDGIPIKHEIELEILL